MARMVLAGMGRDLLGVQPWLTRARRKQRRGEISFRKELRALEREEAGLGADAARAGESCHTTVGADDAVAGHEERPRISAEGCGDGPRAAGWQRHDGGEVAVAARAVGGRGERPIVEAGWP